MAGEGVREGGRVRVSVLGGRVARRGRVRVWVARVREWLRGV
jgi:hypothetical protein